MLMFPSVISGFIFSLLAIVAPTSWFVNTISGSIHLALFSITILLCFRYGDGSFDHFKTTGPYHVGCQDTYLFPKDGGNAVSVFYPMDKHLIKGKVKKPWLDKTRNKKIIGGLRRGFTWCISKPETSMPMWILNSWLYASIDVVQNAQLAEDFASGSKKLVPVIVCHGLSAMKDAYSGIARELASHGYIVFTFDFTDGTCAFTERLVEGNTLEPVLFDRSVPFYSGDKDDADQLASHQNMVEKTKSRAQQAQKLVDFVSTTNMLQDILKMDPTAVLDLEKLVMAGQSFGGAAALKASHDDARIKCCATWDPWICPLKDEIFDGSFSRFVQQQFFIIYNDNFCEESWKPFYPEYNPWATKERLLELLPKTAHVEHSIMTGSKHDYQTDLILAWPFESYMELLGKLRLPPANFADMYMSYTWMTLRFLHQSGFHDGTIDIGTVNKRL